jgi:ribosomal protein L5
MHDELRIKAERERLKLETIKNQMIEFNKSKNKISPFELRPGPPARIEVDLT